MNRELSPQPLQEKFLSSEADIAIFGGAAGSGKLCNIMLHIPTPAGSKLLGEIKDGDLVFDENGHVCTVLKAHEITFPERAYRLTFDDGSVIECGGEHLWLTYTANDLSKLTKRDSDYKSRRRANRPSRATNSQGSYKSQAIAERNRKLAELKRDNNLPLPTGSVKNTDEIVKTLTVRNGTRANHAIPVCKPWQLPEVDLPIPPYTLGCWLGDGSTNSGVITKNDIEIIENIVNDGFDVVCYKSKLEKCKQWGIHGIRTKLRLNGILGHKHIPIKYLRSSYEQRLALMQGLMDTDGYAKPSGSTAEYYTTCPELADNVFDLAISLGLKAVKRSKQAKLNGKDYGLCWTISFSTDVQVFRLPRKLLRHQSGSLRRTNNFRYIINAEVIDPVPMRCLTVDSPSRLYLCGTSGIPTHNTMALLLECLRHIANPQFSAIIFRRETKQIMLPGGLFDAAMKIYPGLGATSRIQPMPTFTFRSGAKIVLTHLNQENDVAGFQGSEISLLVYDELCHFSFSQFLFMLSRNRSTCGVNPYIRASCNPDPDSWVADFISWWIDPETGYPITKRSGQLRYFVQVPTENDTVMVWGDSPEEVAEQLGVPTPTTACRQQAEAAISQSIDAGKDPEQNEFSDELAAAVRYVQILRSAKSVTFIPGLIYDNPALLRSNPEYLANLKALDRVQRARLLHGNWKVRAVAGSYLARGDARFLPEVPNDVVAWVRSWDLAATEPNENNRDPDWTVGMKLGRRSNGRVVIAEVIRFRRNASTVRDIVYDTAKRDGQHCWIQIPRDPGQAGVDQISSYELLLAGYPLFSRAITRNKTAMVEPAAAAWQKGAIELVIASWNNEVLEEFDRFPTPHAHDDCVDALSGGYNLLPSGSNPDYANAGLHRRFLLDVRP